MVGLAGRSHPTVTLAVNAGICCAVTFGRPNVTDVVPNVLDDMLNVTDVVPNLLDGMLNVTFPSLQSRYKYTTTNDVSLSSSP